MKYNQMFNQWHPKASAISSSVFSTGYGPPLNGFLSQDYLQMFLTVQVTMQVSVRLKDSVTGGTTGGRFLILRFDLVSTRVDMVVIGL